MVQGDTTHIGVNLLIRGLKSMICVSNNSNHSWLLISLFLGLYFYWGNFQNVKIMNIDLRDK